MNMLASFPQTRGVGSRAVLRPLRMQPRFTRRKGRAPPAVQTLSSSSLPSRAGGSMVNVEVPHLLPPGRVRRSTAYVVWFYG